MGRYSVVQAETPRQGPGKHGRSLEDPATDSLRLRFRRDLESLAEEEDLEVLRDLGDDLARKAREMGAEKLFEYLESNLSGAVRVTDREEVQVEDFGRALDRLYLKNVQSNVLEFRTHLPRYSLRAAAGKFLENQEISEEGWVEAPEDLRLATDMFVAANRGPFHGASDSRRFAVRFSARRRRGRGRAGWCWWRIWSRAATIATR